jgi:hypothetical protein
VQERGAEGSGQGGGGAGGGDGEWVVGVRVGRGSRRVLGGRAVHVWSRVRAGWRFGVFLAVDEGGVVGGWRGLRLVWLPYRTC